MVAASTRSTPCTSRSFEEEKRDKEDFEVMRVRVCKSDIVHLTSMSSNSTSRAETSTAWPPPTLIISVTKAAHLKQQKKETHRPL